MKGRIDAPHRRNAHYGASIAHRLSGLVLALFLPVHFLLLGLALEGRDAMDRALALTEFPGVKIAEWGLVVFLALHLLLGLRVLSLEFLPWAATPSLRKGWILTGVAGALGVGFIFIAGVI